MTLQELVQLGALMGKKVNDCAIKARMLKDQLMKATTYEEASKISWYPQEEKSEKEQETENKDTALKM